MWKLLPLLKSKKIIIPIILVILGGLSWWKFESALRETGRQAQVIVQQMQTLEDMERRLQEVEAEKERLEALFAQREQQIQEIESDYQELRQDMRTLEQDAQEWADTAVPEPIAERLRQATDRSGDQD